MNPDEEIFADLLKDIERQLKRIADSLSVLPKRKDGKLE